MNKEQAFNMLSNNKDNSMSNYYLNEIVRLSNDIKYQEIRLNNMLTREDTYENKPYIIYHETLSDSYKNDLETLSEMTLDFRNKFEELSRSDKYSQIDFCQIKYIDECPEDDKNNFGWDEDGKFVVSWDSYDGLHTYGQLWCIVVTDKFTGNVKDTLTYKQLEDNIAQLKNELKLNINHCVFFD